LTDWSWRICCFRRSRFCCKRICRSNCRRRRCSLRVWGLYRWSHYRGFQIGSASTNETNKPRTIRMANVFFIAL